MPRGRSSGRSEADGFRDRAAIRAEFRADSSELSPIEPGRVGGAGMAAAVARVVAGHDFGRGTAAVYGRAP